MLLLLLLLCFNSLVGHVIVSLLLFHRFLLYASTNVIFSLIIFKYIFNTSFRRVLGLPRSLLSIILPSVTHLIFFPHLVFKHSVSILFFCLYYTIWCWISHKYFVRQRYVFFRMFLFPYYKLSKIFF